MKGGITMETISLGFDASGMRPLADLSREELRLGNLHGSAARNGRVSLFRLAVNPARFVL
jgi:hypothetical protein